MVRLESISDIKEIAENISNLHSSMVRLERYTIYYHYEIIKKFTFQYG